MYHEFSIFEKQFYTLFFFVPPHFNKV